MAYVHKILHEDGLAWFMRNVVPLPKDGFQIFEEPVQEPDQMNSLSLCISRSLQPLLNCLSCRQERKYEKPLLFLPSL